MKTPKTVSIKKASGKTADFSEKKLITSLQRAGASENLAKEILELIKPRLYEGVTTKKIHHWALGLLKSRSAPLAAKYRLKKGIMELGPSGYPFEKFIAEILKYQGYKTEVGQIVQGKCVKHEIDVIAEKEGQHFMIECKYHNMPGTVSDVKIPLYIQARFKDVESEWKKLPGHENKFHQGWVVTNTRFTVDAMQYGNCAGLKLIGWDYPNGESLRSMIDALKLYPITCLTTLTKTEKEQLLEKKVILCRQLNGNETILQETGIKFSRIKNIMEECRQLIDHPAPVSE